jgi:adenylate cyclase
MTEESFKRKLTAILSADVEGYSRLMGEDEDATIRTLTAYRELMSTLIQKHRGRVVDSPGDNLLAEFLSVVDAVRCAVEIQEELRVRNAELPDNRRMEFRIGINLGDVVQEEERIYGDGINIAARVEGLAEGGGICISGAVHDSIKNKLSLSYESLGEHTVKNIKEPVRVYRMRIGPEAAVKTVPRRWQKAALAAVAVLVVVAGAWAIWNFYFRPPPMEPVSVESMAYPLPDKPSIAVLPLDNMSGDPEQDYFSDGLTEQIISALSKVPKLFVIARNSTFTYKGKPVKVQQVAEELGVRYVLEGSVRKAGDKVRVTAQLVDALTGHHLWSETYDRNLKDIFAIQDEISMKILTAMQVKLTSGERARLIGKGTKNLKAYLKFLEGQEQSWRLNKEANFRAKQLFEEAIALDSDFGLAYGYLGYCHFFDAMYGWSKSPSKSMQRALELAEKALSLDDSQPYSYTLITIIYMLQRQHVKAIAKAEQAVELGPNLDITIFTLGWALRCAGRPEEGIPLLRKALRLDPMPHVARIDALGRAYFLSGRYEEAIAAYRKAVDVDLDFLDAHVGLASTYATLGREEEARTEVAEILRIEPSFSIKKYAKFMQFQVGIEPEIEGLRKAGLSETSPLPLPDKPSIAVLPFVNMSGDPEQEYFSDGLTEEIISGLARVPFLFVIARNSSFTYKGNPVKVQKISKELGVRYVLEGSVRKEGNRVRITAQLIDAISGHHIWSERYDRELKNIFELQDEIMRNILAEMQVQLTAGVQAQLYTKKFQEKKIGFEVFEKHMQSLWHFYRMNPEGFSMARQLAEEAIEIDPNYAPPYTVLAFIHLADIRGGRSKSPRKSMAFAEKFAQKALQLDDSHPMTHITLGQIHLYKRQHEEAIAEGKKALTLSPNGADVHSHLGYFLYYAGRYEEAIPFYEKAIRLNPYPPIFYYQRLASAYASRGRYDEAIDLCKKTLKRRPNYTTAHIVLAMVYIWQDREEEAHAEVAEVLRINPSFTLRRLKAVSLHKNKEDLKRRIEALRKAGLPE